MSEGGSKLYGIGCLALAPVLLLLALPLFLLLGAGGGVQGTPVSPPGGTLNPVGIPQKYVPMLQAAAQHCTMVTAPALAGQDKQESGWNPNAGSPQGAQGLAQFTPATWATWGKDVNHNGRNSPFDPADAIDAQARFMCHLVAQAQAGVSSGQLHGNVLDLAWAGYNAGFGAVQQYGGVPPYPETQQYVVAVRRYMEQYQQQAPVKGDGKFMNPLQGQHYVLTSGFGPRPSPCAGCSSWHFGQDMAVPVGTPIKAACSGRVIAAAYPLGGMGMATVIYCGGGVRTYYAHQSKQYVHAGQTVKIGQIIGLSGNTGNSSGPHLHFEIHHPAAAGGGWYAGTPINPIPFMRKHGAPL